jgi:hypothetical protein
VSAGPKKKRPAGDRPTRADLEEQIDVLLAENRSLREDLDEANEKVEELTKKLEEFQEQPLVAMAKAIGDGLDAPDTKVCTGCGQDKPASEFYRKTIGGHRQPCKVCTKAKEREKYASRNGADSEKAPA